MTAVVVTYLVRAGRYPGSGFTRVIAVPTLAAAVGFAATHARALMKKPARQVSGGERREGSPSTADLPAGGDASERVGPRVPRLLISVSLVTAYVALLVPLGFAISSLLFGSLVPIASGQPVRRLPTLLAGSAVLVVVLGLVVHMSGAIPLPTGVFHIGVSW